MSPGQLYCGVATAINSDGSSITEVTGGAYLRQAVTFANGVNKVFVSSSDVIFPQATTNWGTLAYAVVYDAPVGGNAIAYQPLVLPSTINTGMIYEILTGQLTVTF